MSPAQQLPSPRIKEEWFSLEGPLHMKSLGGGMQIWSKMGNLSKISVLSMMQPRKRYYFGLEEVENKVGMEILPKLIQFEAGLLPQQGGF